MLARGTYVMFAIADTSNAPTPCLCVTVGRHALRKVSFETGSSPANRCEP
jgi:hypothetical protein